MPISIDMLRIPNVPPTTDGEEAPAEPDEPPDHCRVRPRRPSLAINRAFTTTTYAKSKTIKMEARRSESLLTRALLSSPELSPQSNTKLPVIPDLRALTASSTLSNRSMPSTAELTSDSETSSPLRSNTPSPPPQYKRLPRVDNDGSVRIKAPDTRESQLEASLGRKRCITFACGRKLIDEEKKASSEPIKESNKVELPKRKSALTFVCPARPSGPDGDNSSNRAGTRKSPPGSRASRSPAPPSLRKPSNPTEISSKQPNIQIQPVLKVSETNVVELSDAVRYHEFGSESDEDDWLNVPTDYKQKMTMNDCMQKEIAIRKLGEEAEEEARQDEENEEDDEEDHNDEDDEDDDDDDDDEDDENEDDDDGDDGDDGATVQDELSDAGNESDNEAGFASSDDESDNSGDFGFWTPRIASTEGAPAHGSRRTLDRRDSNTSVESHTQNMAPFAFRGRKRTKPTKPIKFPKFRPGTPVLPDSTDFVCGTLDEDRPMEAAYISCMEERRRSKHVPIPQDIDPSFPTSDLEEGDEDDDDDDLNLEPVPVIATQAKASGPFHGFDEAFLRGRSGKPARHVSPARSPKRLQSPPPRRLFARSPKRLRSPPPLGRLRSPPPTRRTSVTHHPTVTAPRVHFTGLGQRPNRNRTSSLPRTPNPFFTRLAQRRQASRLSSPSPTRSTRRQSTHTRGPIDIVAGLEKKREKRKEKFWRQHCRKAAKEQLERKKPLCGKGAERMRERGLEAAERFKAYNVINGHQLVLSV